MRLAPLGQLAHHRHAGGGFHCGEFFLGLSEFGCLRFCPGVVGGEKILYLFGLCRRACGGRNAQDSEHAFRQSLLDRRQSTRHHRDYHFCFL